MPERRGGIYARLDPRPYTRKAETVPEKCYVKGVQRPKIHSFELGDPKGDFELEVSLIADKPIQIKHNALEAARVSAGKVLGTTAGTSFFMKIRVYPHHVLRENPIATGAGADRFQEGMSRSFGKPIGVAARVKKGQKIISIKVNKDKLDTAKEALRRAKMKFPIKCMVLIESLKKEKEIVKEKKK